MLVVTKEELAESNTAYAQGGIAVAMGGEEDVALHLEDTMAAGDGLVDREAAAVLVEEGPQRVEELLRWGTGFDPRTWRADADARRRAQPVADSACQWRCDGRGDWACHCCAQVREHCRTSSLMEWTTSVDSDCRKTGGVVGATLLDREGGLRRGSRPGGAAGQRRRGAGL